MSSGVWQVDRIDLKVVYRRVVEHGLECVYIRE